jgi:hypothetical protein
MDVVVLEFARLRKSPLVRGTLLAAGLLAVAASFGLHPEPSAGEGVAAHRGLASAHTDETAHGCTACLTHVPTLVAPPAVAASASLPRAALDPLSSLEVASGRAGRALSGRSPPSRS